ncbi:MAG: hypothetical protein JSS11_06900 [Verrucomicrobia bacterium]|nr:hypothetical protein [Verrucomicrobiota bacterium]
MPPKKSSAPVTALTLSNRQLAWSFDWSGGALHSTGFENKLSGHTHALTATHEVALVFSAAVDRVAEPLVRVADFVVRRARQTRPDRAEFSLESPAHQLTATLHVQLDGPTRRKWIEFTNTTGAETLFLDVELDDFTLASPVTGGGHGKPIFVADEVFIAIEHPVGDQKVSAQRVQLAHYPGKRLKPKAKFRSYVALVSVAEPGRVITHFTDYVQALTQPRPKMTAIYTPFGINNQWGAHPTLNDEETLDVLELTAQLQKKGVTFDYFTLDTGWVDFSSDLTKFKPTSYPHGPDKMIKRTKALGMKFGLWFGTTWGLQSCWDYPAAYADGKPPTQIYREGYHLGADGVYLCFGEDNYYSIFKRAILHHIRKNGVKFLKFDGGYYHCDKTEHGHLPGKYATEDMFEKLIDLAASARAADPEVFIMWYWGLGSPFWAMFGDAIFESGLFMEGSGASPIPTLYYRDSVTLAQDQNAFHAKTIPPLIKDSLGVWLSDSRWGNFMGMERWRESIVMDLGRGSRLFPNLWGNLYTLTDDDVEFLAWIQAFANKHAAYFQHRRTIPGDPFRNEVYGYAHGQGARSFLFLSNAHFASRQVTLTLDASLGLTARTGTALALTTHFPEKKTLRRPGGKPWQLGDTAEIWLRPFETLMVEVAPPSKAKPLPARTLTAAQAADLGASLALRPIPPAERLDARFAGAADFAAKKFIKKTYTFETDLPALDGAQPILALVIRLRKGEEEWRYAPTVTQIVQTIVRVGDQHVQMTPVPDGRQHGNTQSYGCSWLVCKARLTPEWTRKKIRFAVHANLPEDVEARVEGWVVQRWWEERTRPSPDGYYTYAPS